MSVWYGLVTNIKCEKRAKLGLEEKGFATYLPKFREERRHKRTDRWHVVERLMLPRYLFVTACSTAQDWLSIRTTDGVEGIVCGANRLPTKIPSTSIAELMVAEDIGLFDCMRRRGPIFEVGTHVQINAGPFRGFDGVIRDEKAGRFATVLTRLFGREMPIEVPVGDLIPFREAA